VLTLQLPPTLASRWLLPRLPRLRAALPDLDLRIATNWTDAPDFSRSDVDAIVAYGSGRWPGIVKVPLMRERLAPMCSPAMARRLKKLCDLAQAALLHPGPERREWKQWLAGARARGVSHASGQVFDTLDLALSAATRGQGVAIADTAMLAESLADGVLAMPFARAVPSGRGYYLTCRDARAADRLKDVQAWLLREIGA
uniref:LysR substrate-binding domain-containing protein n=1 Tax=Ramlibacter sp. TaxID=1917967 RepID=UPI0017A42666